METFPEAGTQPAPKGSSTAAISIVEQQAVLAALDAAFDLHLAGASVQQIADALLQLREIAKSHFDSQDRILSNFRQESALAHIERHGSLIRYIDHAIANVRQWSPSQRYIHLRFMNHSITAHINEASASENPDWTL